MVGEVSANYKELDNEWHQYVIDLNKVKGNMKIFFNGYIDNTGGSQSKYIEITLY